jgi:predicted MFS family arabinose efflux permease
MSLNGFVVITMTTLVISLTNKVKPLLNISLAGIFFAIGFGMLYFINSLPMFIVSTIIWTTGEVLNATNAGVYIANNTPSTHRGRFNSAIQIITGAGFALGPLIMGLYINGKNIRNAWPLVFSIETLAALMIFALYLLEIRKERA